MKLMAGNYSERLDQTLAFKLKLAAPLSGLACLVL